MVKGSIEDMGNRNLLPSRLESLLSSLQILLLLALAFAGKPTMVRSQWEPPGLASANHYVGSKVCAGCHQVESATQPKTYMAQALSPAADSEILQRNRRLTGRLGKYSYQIISEGGKSLYTVSDGTRSTVQTILWAVGQGRGAQSYLYKQNGVFHEARVSYFSQIGSLDLTLGHPHAEPPGLDEAAGRPLTDFDVAKCINCHSTRAQPESGLQLTHMTPGITCENCHGPGAQHVAAVRNGKKNELRIFNPGRLQTEDLIYNFCGSCHRNAFDVANNGASGITTIRFEPYRLVLSRCYNPRDRRISCLACHNPHERMQQAAAFYDAKCLDCHDGSNRPKSAGRVVAPRCPIAIKNCVSCHMPKYELPGDHFKFADHDIRIVRLNDRFPG